MPRGAVCTLPWDRRSQTITPMGSASGVNSQTTAPTATCNPRTPRKSLTRDAAANTSALGSGSPRRTSTAQWRAVCRRCKRERGTQRRMGVTPSGAAAARRAPMRPRGPGHRNGHPHRAHTCAPPPSPGGPHGASGARAVPPGPALPPLTRRCSVCGRQGRLRSLLPSLGGVVATSAGSVSRRGTATNRGKAHPPRLALCYGVHHAAVDVDADCAERECRYAGVSSEGNTPPPPPSGSGGHGRASREQT